MDVASPGTARFGSRIDHEARSAPSSTRDRPATTARTTEGDRSRMSRPYRNPVHRGYFADPFVLPVDGGYLAVGTGRRVDGRPFEMLRSADLVQWESVGGALEPLSPELADRLGGDYWAPEIAQEHGRWWMYY